MDLNEMRRRFKEQKTLRQDGIIARDNHQSTANASVSVEPIQPTSISSTNDQGIAQTPRFNNEASSVDFFDEDKTSSVSGNNPFPEGSRYEGDSVAGQRNGMGTQIWPDGSKYSGYWKNNQRNGSGIYTLPDGTRYDGQWVADKRNGAGTQIWPDGTRYVGNWVNDQRNGSGVMVWSNGSRFEGTWNNDCIYKGHYYYKEGHHYEGTFNSDWQRDGYGTLYLTDGSFHRGYWEKNKRHGYGQNFDKNNVLIREGEWVNNKFEKACKASSPSNDADQAVWNESTTKAINLLFQLEKCNWSERKESLAIVKSLRVPVHYVVVWNQIVRIWSGYAKDLCINTKVLPNPDGVRYSQRPFPITGSLGVQDLIKEIIKYA